MNTDQLQIWSPASLAGFFWPVQSLSCWTYGTHLRQVFLLQDNGNHQYEDPHDLKRKWPSCFFPILDQINKRHEGNEETSKAPPNTCSEGHYQEPQSSNN